MKKSRFAKCALALAGALLFLAPASRAQTQTNVTATIKDPLGIPYAGGTYSIQLIPTGNNPSVNGAAIGGAFNGRLDATGSFNVSLWPNASIVPAATTWQFTICIPGGIPLPLGTGGQCTPPTAVTIAGAAQSLSATLSAVAPALTSIIFGFGSVTSVSGTAPIVATPNPIVGAGTISCPTCNTSSATIGGSISLNQVAIGSAANTISGSLNFINHLTTGETDITSPSGAETFVLIPNTGVGNQTTFLANASGIFQITPAATGVIQLTMSTSGLTLAASVTAGTEINMLGSSSGTASFGVAAAAGSPNRINIPTLTGSAGTFLQTNGANPQQSVWDTLLVDNGTSLTYTGTGGVSAPILTSTANGAVSTPSISVTGALFTGGTGTTTLPLVYINNGAVAPTTWATVGTEFGINAPAGFTGNFADWRVNGGNALFVFEGNGSLVATGSGTFNGGLDTTFMASTFGPALFYITTNPTILAAGCGGAAASIPNANGTLSFQVNVGTANTGTCTVTMPAATTEWTCGVSDITTTSATVFMSKQTGALSTTSITLRNFTTAGAGGAWTDSDVLNVICSGT